MKILANGLKKYTEAELNEILRKHDLWINNKPGGERALLDHASLSHASLSHASLDYASLEGASLDHASLEGASLDHAYLDYASLVGADLRDVKNLFVPMCCPSEGSFVGWKKCRGDRIVKLLIDEDAKRSSATGRKCRCSGAKVLSIYNRTGSVEYHEALSTYDKSFTYKVGEHVSVPDFDDNRWKECAAGIHFFITREEAESY